MERQITFSAPPMFPNELTPNEIVGRDNMSIFVAHLRICYSSVNNGEWPEKRLSKEIGPANRERIIGILRELRENGYLPLSVDEHGKVRWGMMVKTQSQVEFERDLPRFQRMPIEELQRLGRSGYLQIRDNVTVDQYHGPGISRCEVVDGQYATNGGEVR
jgi:hypothetical protein